MAENNNTNGNNGNGKRKVGFRYEISLGNILAVVAILVGFSVKWGMISQRFEEVDKQLISVEQTIARFETELARHESDTRVHYMISSPAEERLTAMTLELAKLNAEISELNKLIEKHIMIKNP